MARLAETFGGNVIHASIKRHFKIENNKQEIKISFWNDIIYSISMIMRAYIFRGIRPLVPFVSLAQDPSEKRGEEPSQPSSRSAHGIASNVWRIRCLNNWGVPLIIFL